MLTKFKEYCLCSEILNKQFPVVFRKEIPDMPRKGVSGISFSKRRSLSEAADLLLRQRENQQSAAAFIFGIGHSRSGIVLNKAMLYGVGENVYRADRTCTGKSAVLRASP